MLLLAAGLFCGTVGADDYHEQMNRLKALDKLCEQARAVRLAPIRERYFQDCQKDRHKTMQDCRIESSGYGQSTIGPNRNLIRGIYYDLPECLQAEQAWKKWWESQPLIR